MPSNSHIDPGMVLEAQSPIVKQFWDALLPAQGSEQPCLQQWHRNGYHPTSFKDVHAQAHCVAGYLMRRGIGKGDTLGIVAKPGLRYHVLHIALQYLGIINITIPPSLSADEIEQMAFKYDFKMLFVESVEQFLGYGEFKDLKAGLLGVIIGEDDVDALAPEKIVTFDRVVTLGKSAWREEANTLKAMKAAVTPQSTYAILVDADGKTTPVTMQQWMAEVDAADKLMTEANSKTLLTTLAPDRLIWRSCSFAAIRRGNLWSIRSDNDLKAALLSEVKPHTILLNPDDLRLLYNLLPEWLETSAPDKGRKAVAAALEVVRKRNQAQAEGKKDKFMNRFRYRTANRKLYSRIKAKLGGAIALFIHDRGLIDADARLLLEECGIVIRSH